MAPSFFSVVGATVAVAVPVGCPREKVGRVPEEIRCESREEKKCCNNLLGALSFFSADFPLLFVAAPRLLKSPPPAKVLYKKLKQCETKERTLTCASSRGWLVPC